VIGNFGRADLSEAACALEIPVVSVHGGSIVPGLTQFGIDRRRQGVFAAEWFLQHGLPNFGFFGLGGQAFSDPQQEGFVARMQEANRQVYTWSPTPEERAKSRIGEKDQTVRWL